MCCFWPRPSASGFGLILCLSKHSKCIYRGRNFKMSVERLIQYWFVNVKQLLDDWVDEKHFVCDVFSHLHKVRNNQALHS